MRWRIVLLQASTRDWRVSIRACLVTNWCNFTNFLIYLHPISFNDEDGWLWIIFKRCPWWGLIFAHGMLIGVFLGKLGR